MMLIHVLQDDRLERALEHYECDPSSIIWHHYQSLGPGLNRKETSNIGYLASQLEQNAPWQGKERYKITSEFINKIHILEWRGLLRSSGLEEGSEPFCLTERVLDQALSEVPRVNRKARQYLEVLENDLNLIAQTNESKLWIDKTWNYLTLKADEQVRRSQLKKQRRRILIDGFGAQGESLTTRNAALEALTPALPAVPNGTCQQCRSGPGSEYKFDYGRYIGGFVWKSSPPAQVTHHIQFHKFLGSFTVFYCDRCKWKYLSRRLLLSVFALVASALMIWLSLSQLIRLGDRSSWPWILVLLLAGVTALAMLFVFIPGAKSSLLSYMQLLGAPKHLGVDRVYTPGGAKGFWAGTKLD